MGFEWWGNGAEPGSRSLERITKSTLCFNISLRRADDSVTPLVAMSTWDIFPAATSSTRSPPLLAS